MPTSALCCAETTTAEMRLGVPSSYSTLTCALPSGRRQQLFAPHLLELSRQAVRKRDRQRHQRAGLAAGVAEHHTLIARAGFLRRAAVNPARDVRRLGVDADADAHVFGVKADDGHGIADLGDDLARNGFIVRHIG